MGPEQEAQDRQNSKESNFSLNVSDDDNEANGAVDLMFVFPIGEEYGDNDPLPSEGFGSAAWYLRNIITDDDVFAVDNNDLDLTPAEVEVDDDHSPNHTLRTLYLRSDSTIATRGGGTPRAVTIDLPQDSERSTSTSMTRDGGTPRAVTIPTQQDSEERGSVSLAQYTRSSVETRTVVNRDLVSQYDRVLASKTLGELRRGVRELLIRFILSSACGAHVRAFQSVDGDELFVAVTGREMFLKAQADRVNYRLQLDEDIAISLLGGQFKRGEISPPYLPYDVTQDQRFTERFGQCPFRLHYKRYKQGSVLNGMDRLRILTGMIGNVFSIEDMINLKLLVNMYPCHNQVSLEPLAAEWSNLRRMFSLAVPVEQIAGYFGEQFGFRICFLNFLNRCSVPLALVAPILGFLPGQHWVQIAVGFGMAVWAALIYELWKRTELHWRIAWGMDHISILESKRPRFKGTWGTSPIDRISQVKQYPHYKLMIRRAISGAFTVFFNVIVVCTTWSLYELHAHLKKQGLSQKALLINYAIAGQMQVYNLIWTNVSVLLVEFDNYETMGEYYDAFVLRTFGFRFINSFFGLFYVAFLKRFLVGCGPEGCMDELALQLMICFIIQLAFEMFSMVIPALSLRCRLWMETWQQRKPGESVSSCGGEEISYQPLSSDSRGNSRTQKQVYSYLEAQAKLQEYRPTDEAEDRIAGFINLGYVLFFALVAPQIIPIFMIGNVVHLRGLMWKLMHVYQRPFPAGASGLGNELHKIFVFMTKVAIACNLVLVLMINSEGTEVEDIFLKVKENLSTVSFPRDKDWKSMLAVFFLLERFVTVVQLTIDYYVPDEPRTVTVELKRRQVIEREWYKLMLNDDERQEMDAMYAGLSLARKHAHVQHPETKTWVPIDCAKIITCEGVGKWNSEDRWFERVGFVGNVLQRVKSTDLIDEQRA